MIQISTSLKNVQSIRKDNPSFLFYLSNQERKIQMNLKEKYPKGTKIKCISMDDPYHPVPAGTIGIVDHIDDAGTIHMKWENGSSLGLIEGQDQFEVIKPKIKDKSKEMER